MNKVIAVGVGALLFIAFVLFSTTYTVKYNEVAIKATFAKVDEDSVVRDPGLHFRLPLFIDSVSKLDTRLQVVESPIEEVVTADGLQVMARGFMLWQVETEGTGPFAFFEAYESLERASSLLAGQFRTSLVAGLGAYRFDELIGAGSKLGEAEEAIRASMSQQLADEGVRAVTVGIAQLMLPPRTAQAVVERMEEERQNLSGTERQKGEATRSALEASANTAADMVTSFATQRAAEIRAEAENRRADLLAEMSEEEGLAKFLMWLQALEASLTSRTTIVLETDAGPPWAMLDPTGSGMQYMSPASAQPGAMSDRREREDREDREDDGMSDDAPADDDTDGSGG